MQAGLFAQRALFVAHCDGVNHSSLQVPWYQACEYETRRIRPLKRRNAHQLSATSRADQSRNQATDRGKSIHLQPVAIPMAHDQWRDGVRQGS